MFTAGLDIKISTLRKTGKATLLYTVLNFSVPFLTGCLIGVVLGLGIREYSSAAQRMLSGITLGNVPIGALYYIPVFMVLVISFVRYWETIGEEKAKPIEENKAKKGKKK